MPSDKTITAYYTFTSNTKARASQVNSNFGNYRGHIIPIEVNTIAAINNTYDLGGGDYSWRRGFFGTGVVLDGDTSTAETQIGPNSGNNLGGINITIDSGAKSAMLRSPEFNTATVGLGGIAMSKYMFYTTTGNGFGLLQDSTCTIEISGLRPVIIEVLPDAAAGWASQLSASSAYPRLSVGPTNVSQFLRIQCSNDNTTNADFIFYNTLASQLEVKGQYALAGIYFEQGPLKTLLSYVTAGNYNFWLEQTGGSTVNRCEAYRLLVYEM